MPSESLSQLDARSRSIFKQIVETYLETGAPVGSRNVSRILAAALSPASIRNIMSDLEAVGLIYAPHTSAGRLPTETGLRFFVDTLMETGALAAEDRLAIEERVRAGDRTPESLFAEASQMLSTLSHGAGVVLTTKNHDLRLRHIEFVRIEASRALAVLVAEGGAVENRVIDVPPGLPAGVLVEASNYLNSMIAGLTLAEARRAVEAAAAERRREIDALTRSVIDAGLATWSEARGEEAALIVRGRSNLIDAAAGAEDVERLRHLLDDLESKTDILQLLGLAEAGDGVRIFIGSENKLFSLSGSSLVVAPFRDREDRVVGVLGIIGPKRLNYARVVPAVDFTAQLIGQLVRG